MISETINYYLKKNPVTRKFYKGCFASDIIPDIGERFPASMVLNEDTHDRPGTHWIALFAPTKDTVYYFDSLARIPKKEILNYLIRFPNIIRNRKGYQSMFSNVCGFYVIFFIYMCSRGFTMDKIELILSSKKDPDKFVTTFVLSVF